MEVRTSTASFHIKQTADTAIKTEELNQKESVAYRSEDSKLLAVNNTKVFVSPRSKFR